MTFSRMDKKPNKKQLKSKQLNYELTNKMINEVAHLYGTETLDFVIDFTTTLITQHVPHFLLTLQKAKKIKYRASSFINVPDDEAIIQLCAFLQNIQNKIKKGENVFKDPRIQYYHEIFKRQKIEYIMVLFIFIPPNQISLNCGHYLKSQTSVKFIKMALDASINELLSSLDE